MQQVVVTQVATVRCMGRKKQTVKHSPDCVAECTARYLIHGAGDERQPQVTRLEQGRWCDDCTNGVKWYLYWLTRFQFCKRAELRWALHVMFLVHLLALPSNEVQFIWFRLSSLLPLVRRAIHTCVFFAYGLGGLIQPFVGVGYCVESDEGWTLCRACPHLSFLPTKNSNKRKRVRSNSHRTSITFTRWRE